MDSGTDYIISLNFNGTFELWTVYLRVGAFDWVSWEENLETKGVGF